MPNRTNDNNDDDNEATATTRNSRKCFCSTTLPTTITPKDIFGVEMNNGVAAKIVTPNKFLDWSWWALTTPYFRSTVKLCYSYSYRTYITGQHFFVVYIPFTYNK